MKLFLEAGGDHALADAIWPVLLLQDASPHHNLSLTSDNGENADDVMKNKENYRPVGNVDAVRMNYTLNRESITITFLILALVDFVKERMDEKDRGGPNMDKGDDNKSKWKVKDKNEEMEEDDASSLDSVTRQVRAMSRMVVSESDYHATDQKGRWRRLVVSHAYVKVVWHMVTLRWTAVTVAAATEVVDDKSTGDANMTTTTKEDSKKTVAKAEVVAKGDVTQAYEAVPVEPDAHEIAPKDDVVAVEEKMKVNGLKAAKDPTVDSAPV